MSELFELVRDHVEAFDVITQEWETRDGIKTVELSLCRPAAWIERVHERGVMTALDCVAIIFFVLDDWSAEPTREQEIQLAEGWAKELRRAATAGEIQARHPFTLLPLPNVPEGLDWGLLESDADKFVTARGMAWKFGDIAAHIYREALPDIESKRFPSFLEDATPAQPQAATPAPVVADNASNTPAVMKSKAKRRTWWDVSSPYIVEVMQAGQYATGKELYRALEAKAGNDSPFDKGTGNNRGSLFVREIARPLSMKTMQNKMGKLRELAEK